MKCYVVCARLAGGRGVVEGNLVRLSAPAVSFDTPSSSSSMNSYIGTFLERALDVADGLKAPGGRGGGGMTATGGAFISSSDLTSRSSVCALGLVGALFLAAKVLVFDFPVFILTSWAPFS